MATITRFEDIEASKKARELNREVYRITRGELYLQRFPSPRSDSEIVGLKFCQTSRRGLSGTGMRNSDSSFTLPKDPLVKCVRNSMPHWTPSTLIGRPSTD